MRSHKSAKNCPAVWLSGAIIMAFRRRTCYREIAGLTTMGAVLW